jgi:N-hydroxyarylamine O-acetyltransferase
MGMGGFMQPSVVDAAAYLARIRHEGSFEPSLSTLQALHAAHLRTVPFEDIDVYLKRPVDLSTPALFEKIVRRNRGGFCYELNGLFAELLRELGFQVTLLNAQVSRKEARFGPPFDHLALLVDLERPWLADVGYPRSPLTPLALDTDQPQVSDGVNYRLSREHDSLCLFQQTDEVWVPEYRFDLLPRRIEDFAETCRFHETSPESPFHGWLGCTLVTHDGRVTLSDDKLIVRSNGIRTETAVVNTDIASILASRFGIELDHDWT